MPTFKKRPEIVDAKQFTGGVQNGTNLTFWVQSNHGRGDWREAGDRFAEHIRLDSEKRYQWQYAYVGDWIMMNQDGSFKVVRQQELDADYEQV